MANKLLDGADGRPTPKPRSIGDFEYDQSLFEELRKLRKEIAAEQGVPPFVVFSDASLAEMAAVRPRDDESMLGITGVGQHKLEKYGARFLEVLQTQEAGAPP